MYAPWHQVKFLVCVNLPGNKPVSDSDSEVVIEQFFLLSQKKEWPPTNDQKDNLAQVQSATNWDYQTITMNKHTTYCMW